MRKALPGWSRHHTVWCVARGPLTRALQPSDRAEAMTHMPDDITQIPALTIGLDVGDRTTQLYAVNAAGQCVAERTLPTTAVGLAAAFTDVARVAWCSRWGHSRRGWRAS